MVETKLTCSFCDTEIECPNDMLDANKHICFECFKNKPELHKLDLGKVHIDIPPEEVDEIGPELMMSHLMSSIFPAIWIDAKNELKDLSKKELAEAMFAAGAGSVFKLIEHIQKTGNSDSEDSFVERE